MQRVDTNTSSMSYAALNDETSASAVSWSSVFAGAAAATVLSLLLFMLGFGLGLSTLSPWHRAEAAFAWSAVAWVAFTQIAASGLGGYLAGRLRVKWSRVHTDEIYFRDTAHGFLAWAIASLITVAVFSSSLSSLVSGAAKVGAVAATTGAAEKINSAPDGSPSNNLEYFVDNLLRSAAPSSNPAQDADDRSEILRIFSHSLAVGELSSEDKTYAAQLIARRTGTSPAEAEQRLTVIYNQAHDAVEQAKAAADKARKAAAYTALWMFVALLCGAFIASICATWGGKQRDVVIS